MLSEYIQNLKQEVKEKGLETFDTVRTFNDGELLYPCSGNSNYHAVVSIILDTDDDLMLSSSIFDNRKRSEKCVYDRKFNIEWVVDESRAKWIGNIMTSIIIGALNTKERQILENIRKAQDDLNYVLETGIY